MLKSKKVKVESKDQAGKANHPQMGISASFPHRHRLQPLQGELPFLSGCHPRLDQEPPTSKREHDSNQGHSELN